MTLPSLLAQPSQPTVLTVSEPQPAPTRNEWIARFPEIKRLYVHERRKLRSVMQYMERQYGFKATEQMYKKRFAKWGLQKNSKRSADTVPILAIEDRCGRPVRRKHNRARCPGLMPNSLQLGYDDSLSLSFLVSVRKWSVAFFESTRPEGECLACPLRRVPTAQLWPENAKETSFTLKLVGDLLKQGHGILAGRMARKAFLLIESMLTLEGPALIWNLLEIMYHLVKLRHGQLFRLLLAHLIALTSSWISKTHPLLVMLQDLQGLVASFTSRASAHDSSLSPTLTSISGNGDSRSAITILLSLLKDAWVLNAEILLNNFNPQLSQLYNHLQWEECSIGLPSAIIGTAKQWLRHIDMQQKPSPITHAQHAKDILRKASSEEDGMLKRLLAPRMDASPPQDYEMLQASTVKALWQYGGPILSKRFPSESETARTLRVLPALVKARIFNRSISDGERSSAASSETTRVSHSQANNLACAIRVLIDINDEHSGDRIGVLPSAVERIQSVVALREYASSEMDPQVMREMWLLQDVLAAAGEHGKAQEVRQSLIHCLGKYTQDIPPHSV